MKKRFLIPFAVGLGGVIFMTPFLTLANHLGVDHVEAGKAVYEGTCIACHGPDGKGVLPGMPNFKKKNSPLSQPDSVLLDHIMNGFASPGSDIPMPPLGGSPDLTEQDIKYVVEYLREEFGN